MLLPPHLTIPLANLFGGLPLDNWLLLLVLALLIFGKRLPEVGRSLGKGIVEFKKGLAGVEQDVEEAGKEPNPPQPALEARYKFDPYTGKPIQSEPAQPQMRFDPYTGKPLTEQTAGQQSGSPNA